MEALKYFAMVSGALFLSYLAYQECKPTAITTGASTTYNYLTQAAPPAVAAAEIHQEIHVGGAAAEQGPAGTHQWGSNDLGSQSLGISDTKPQGLTPIRFGKVIA